MSIWSGTMGVKMKYNTRFNPTITGPLHIGHLYMALVNEAEAHCTGGIFIVRMEDTQPYWCNTMKKDEQAKYYEEYQEQLSLFMDVDVWDLQSQMPAPEEIIGDFPILKKYPIIFWGNSPVEWKAVIHQKVWSYSPRATVEKVVWDFWEGVNLLIRGDDLLSEANLYAHFIEEIGLPRMRQIYLPRLVTQDQQDKIISPISKTDRVYLLETQIKELGVEETLYCMRHSCLIDPEGGFYVDNIKPNPIAQGFKE